MAGKVKPKKQIKKQAPLGLQADPNLFIPKILESGEVKTLLEWEAPSRPFRKKDRSYYG